MFYFKERSFNISKLKNILSSAVQSLSVLRTLFTSAQTSRGLYLHLLINISIFCLSLCCLLPFLAVKTKETCLSLKVLLTFQFHLETLVQV